MRPPYYCDWFLGSRHGLKIEVLQYLPVSGVHKEEEYDPMLGVVSPGLHCTQMSSSTSRYVPIGQGTHSSVSHTCPE